MQTVSIPQTIPSAIVIPPLAELLSLPEFEINVLIARVLGHRPITEYTGSNIGFTPEFHKVHPHTVWVDKGDGCIEQCCYTRDPGDATAVIFQFKLSLLPHPYLDAWAALAGPSLNINSDSIEVSGPHIAHQQPFMAAMLCLLDNVRDDVL